MTASRLGGHDPWQREVARQVQAAHPGWLVIWGTWSRRFWAFACFDATQPVLVSAPDAAELIKLMNEAACRPR
jgi:hypothetical protein